VGTLAWGSSLCPIALRASSIMQKAAIACSSIVATIFFWTSPARTRVGSNLG
jgi:hypothetical protein